MPKKIYSELDKKIKNPLVKEVWESKIKQKPSKNKHISYSSLSTYGKCPKLWEMMYLRKQVPFTQNIYTCFGTAFHETMQEWLEILYYDKVKTANCNGLSMLYYTRTWLSPINLVRLKTDMNTFHLNKRVNGVLVRW